MLSPETEKTASKAEDVIPETKREDASKSTAETPKQKPDAIAKRKVSYLKIKFALGLVSLVVGLLAANLALFHWVEEGGVYYLLGEYAPYVCAYGGFGAMIFGAMLINDFLTFRKSMAKDSAVTRWRKVAFQRILAKARLLLAEHSKKSSTADHEINTLYDLEKQ